MIRRAVGVTAVACLLLGGLALPAQARDRSRQCTYQSLYSQSWTRTEVKKTVQCFAKKFGVSVSTAVYVADRESNFDRFAWNHSSDCRGIYQHMYPYWAGRVFTARKALHHYDVHDVRWMSPRAQAVVTFRMVKHGGWGPWTTAP